MTEALKVLAQSAPIASTLTDAYTVPALTTVTVSSISVCNPNNATTKFRVAIAVAAAADAPKQYLYYDMDLTRTNTFIATVGITLGAGDVVRVYADRVNVAFQLFGVEVS